MQSCWVVLYSSYTVMVCSDLIDARTETWSLFTTPLHSPRTTKFGQNLQSSLLQPEQVPQLFLLDAIGMLESHSCMHYIMHCRLYSLPLVCPRFSCLEEVLSSFGIVSYWIELFISLLYYGVAVLCIYIFLLQFGQLLRVASTNYMYS